MHTLPCVQKLGAFSLSAKNSKQSLQNSRHNHAMPRSAKATADKAPADKTASAPAKSAPQKALEKLGLVRPIDLALHIPMRYEDETQITPLKDCRDGDTAQIEGEVTSCEVVIRGRRQLVVMLDDGTDVCSLRFLHFYPSQLKQLAVGQRIRARGELRGGMFGWSMLHPACKSAGGVLPSALTPVYSTVAALPQNYLRKTVLSGLDQAGRSGALQETIPEVFLKQTASMSGWTLQQSLSFLHYPAPDVSLAQLEDRSHPAWQRLKLEELLAQQLSQLESKRERDALRAPRLVSRVAATNSRTASATEPADAAVARTALLRDNSSAVHSGASITVASSTASLRDRLLAAIPFQLTAAQQRVCAEIAQDIARDVPMHRLLQGDVGSGKTVVAALAAAVCIDAGYQCALMAPTEILAEQHFSKLISWLEPLGITVARLSGSQKTKERRAMLALIASGEAALVVGTHAVIQEKVQFHKLALAIIDEQHRFGVKQRLALREKMQAGVDANPDVDTDMVLPPLPLGEGGGEGSQRMVKQGFENIKNKENGQLVHVNTAQAAINNVVNSAVQSPTAIAPAQIHKAQTSAANTNAAQHTHSSTFPHSAVPQQEPHLLMMTATPIPRTLAMSYYADLDVSTIDELPPGRTPIITKVISDARRDEVVQRIRAQIEAGRQVYWVCPLIEESEAIDLTNATETHAELSAALQGTAPSPASMAPAPHTAAQSVDASSATSRQASAATAMQAKSSQINPASPSVSLSSNTGANPEYVPIQVGLLHSRMPPADKKAVMAQFTSGHMQVLVSTTVIEVGVDVPNASLMVIEHAERFGLSQLHQLRGRVGRGAAASACVLMYATGESGKLGETARARLKAMADTNDGFEIAKQDLEIRGPGEFLGARQSGAALLRFADLTTDAQLLQTARQLAPRMLDQHKELAEKHIARWLCGRVDYLKA
jgi:ATP-dependent DNA helicase RecG